MKSKKRPAGLEAAMNHLKSEAHERVLSRGLVQFRLDRESMEELLRLSDEKGLGYGVLARMWICERLEAARQGSDAIIPRQELRQIVKEEVRQALTATS